MATWQNKKNEEKSELWIERTDISIFWTYFPTAIVAAAKKCIALAWRRKLSGCYLLWPAVPSPPLAPRGGKFDHGNGGVSFAEAVWSATRNFELKLSALKLSEADQMPAQRRVLPEWQKQHCATALAEKKTFRAPSLDWAIANHEAILPWSLRRARRSE